MKRHLTIEYGDEVLLGVGLSQEEFAREAAFLLAAKLYDMGKLSSGQAARLCGLERVDFLFALPRIGVNASNLRAEDAQTEIAFGQHG